MKNRFALFIITFWGLLVMLLSCARVPVEKPYYKLSVEEIDRDIRETASKNLSVPDRMSYYSERFLGAPYDINCEGDGPYARYETMPLLNLKKLNCMTYCEIVMALALADYYEDFFNILQNIRYRQGIIGMATRNHYTMADWLPANAWCLDDVSHRVGGEDTEQLTRTISHKKFFAGKGITDIPIMLPDREVTIDYIPLTKLVAHEDSLQSGDIVALIQDRPAIFSAHMLLIIKKSGQTFFRHASMSAGRVIDSPFRDYIMALQEKPRYMGMSFMRLKDHVQWQAGTHTHGKFILGPKERTE